MLTIDHSPIFELKHVTKSYGNNMAVKDGNLRIYPGEVHALMGGNGAGKSTMQQVQMRELLTSSAFLLIG